MRNQRDLLKRIIQCCGSDLSKSQFDVERYSQWIKPPEDLGRTAGVCAITGEHPHDVAVDNSSIQGSYLLGKCHVKDSVLYCSDLRGDELKCASEKCALDEAVRVQDSYLYKALVHSNSHDPENPSEFYIRNSIVMHFANVHGSPIEGCFLKPFATIDLTTAKNCALGAYSYVQAGKLENRVIEDGVILISARDFQFEYSFDPKVLQKYIRIEPGGPTGMFVEFLDKTHTEIESLFGSGPSAAVQAPGESFCNPYSVMKGKIQVGRNVFVSQRAFIENASLGDGANVQENCCVIDSVLEGNNVSAHGSKMIHANLAKNNFVGFNSFLKGAPDKRLKIGEGCIVAPHTIIDAPGGIDIPSGSLVWGYVGSQGDLAANSIALEKLAGSSGELKSDRMVFRGQGGAFVKGFRHRIEHILEGNGALFSKDGKRGHAQMYGKVSFRGLEPEREGELKGFFSGKV